MLREPFIGILSVLILIGSAQCFFFSVVFLFMRRGNRRANLFLAAVTLSLSILMVDGFMNVTNYYSRYPRLIGVAWPVYFLVGPLFYFYVRELSTPKRLVFPWRQFFYFLPAIVSALVLILFYHMRVNENVPRLFGLLAPLGGITFPTLNAVPHLAVFQNAVYCVLSYLLIRAYSAGIKQSYSSLETTNLSWLRALLFSFIGLIFLFIFLSYVAVTLDINRESTYFFYLIWAGADFIIACKVVLHPEIYSWIAAANQKEFIQPDLAIVPAMTASEPDKSLGDLGTSPKEKYQKSWLTDERMAEIADQLLQLMETDKTFLEPELTLPELAERLSISPHHLSQVINRKMNKSFFVLVNEYRVQEAKRLLISPQHDHISIFGIALDAGFNSKTTFNTAFVKFTGMTPSKFRIQQESARQRATQQVVGRA
jgi:AraC-like DNA-binding protein